MCLSLPKKLIFLISGIECIRVLVTIVLQTRTGQSGPGISIALLRLSAVSTRRVRFLPELTAMTVLDLGLTLMLQ